MRFPGFVGTIGALRLLSVRPSASSPRRSVPPPGVFPFGPEGRPPGALAACRPGPGHRWTYAVILPSGGDREVSQVPGQPSCTCLCSSTPVGSLGPTTLALGCCLPPSQQRRLPQLSFRGSIAPPMHSLCTLRPSGHPSGATLGSGWWSALPGGTHTHRAAARFFQCLRHGSSSQAWPGAL